MMLVSTARLLVPLLLGASPLTREQPDVRAGNERLLQGDAPGALERYQAAERAVGPRPELDYDRGIAFLRAGKTAEALAALRRAAERGDGPLASRALQNAGGALDAAGDRDGAIRAFGDALARDPANEDARFNLEVLLRRRSQEKKSGGSKDQPEKREAKSGQREEEQAKSGGKPDERGDRKSGRERPESSQQKDGRRPDGGQPRAEDQRGDARGSAAADTEAKQRSDEAGRARTGEPTSRQDAERLLDAMRARERNLPPGAWQRRDARRRDVEKDW
jgi:Ca-activated chloride channel family protein